LFILRDKLKKFDICIRMIGDLSLLPDDLQQTMGKIMEITKDNKTLD
jgi:undecaprenyl diphosphate synthase